MKKFTAILVALILVVSSISVFALFDDIDNGTLAWAGDAINQLSEAGIINGYTDGTFRPDNSVTRAEFAKMVSVAFNLEKANAEYDDIYESWAKEYITKLGDAMYSAGSNFEPDKPATRADIAYCVSSVLGLELKDKDFANKYSDFENVLADMQNKVGAAVENGILIGYEDSTLRPNNSVTRAEAAVIISRALEIYNKSETEPVEPPVSEETEKPIPEDTQKPEIDHLANLYPGKDLILVVSANQTVDSKGDVSCKLTYRLAGDTTEYSSIIPYDTAVVGVKNNVNSLDSGDVLIMNTAFLGHIGKLHVLASFGNSVFNFDQSVAKYGKDTYSLEGGLIKNIKRVNKRLIVTLESNGIQKDVYINSGTEVIDYAPWKNGSKWSYGDIVGVNPQTESEYVYIRYTNGISTEVILSNFTR